MKHVDDVGRRSVSASGNVQSVKGISSALKLARWVAAKLVAASSQGCAGECEVEAASSDETRVVADADNHAVHTLTFCRVLSACSQVDTSKKA